MNAEKWRKIDELFHAALKIEADKRIQFIKAESGGDVEMISEVSKLISAHEQSNSFIQNPIANQALKAISEDDFSEKATKNFRPKTIGPYLLLEKLGRGAFGEVWLAEKESSLVTAKFALKFPKDDDIELEAIRKEAELWQKASGHPNILPLIEANVYNDKAVIVSEYVKDGSLEVWLKNNGGKSPSQAKAVEIMNGILDGLEHLHNRRIIHRDLKPANILMQEGKPRLTDFGVSKILKDEGNTTKNISGTVAYMSPEALEGKRNLQSDLWSAAVVFYQILSGQMPFQTPDQVSLMLSIVTKEPLILPPNVKDKWSDFFKIALNKKSNLRFQSASQMKQAMNLAWENLSLEPATRQYQKTVIQTENKTEDFETKPMLLNAKQGQKTSSEDFEKLPVKKRFWQTALLVGISGIIGFVVLSAIFVVAGWYLYPKQNYQTNKSENANTTQKESIKTSKRVILGNQYYSRIYFEANPGETILKIKAKAQIDNAGATLYFKDENGNEIVPFIIAQANTIEGETVETVKIDSDKTMLVTMEIKEIQYGSRSSYPGTLDIDFSGAFGRLKD